MYNQKASELRITYIFTIYPTDIMGLEELVPGNIKRVMATSVESSYKEYVRVCIEHDGSGKCFVSVMDKFSMYFAFNEGNKGKTLTRNTATHYNRQAKLWLLDEFPPHQTACSSGFLDAELLCLLWYLPGRASDLALLLKPNTPIDADYVLFACFIRMKTSEEQGLSLFS
ncbi:Hypothetical protein PHPALM_21234 [Phytophthora palmivora]|uniref:Uncharacterized protein n=1 Tax=Phytophthora palmivora TaxID=4796 RepID=A0A2P4XCW6_9STRA|nr:Hypothetical protein PHPALM_21234 [Phytophthora palmivora]